MPDDADDHKSPPGLDLGRLADHLAAATPGLLGPDLSASLVPGGRSNLTYVVGDGTRTVVVRRPPLGHVLATAHDMAREYRVITALHDTAVPVPETYAVCEDEDVIGAPFYVMEHVAGTPFRRADELAALGPDRTRAVALRMVDTLATLHSVDPDSVGLSDFGRPDGFLERQVRRWGRQLEGSRSRELPGADELHARLARGIPEPSPAAIVHGDFRLDNCLVGADDEITAVLDWEMATIGDPLTDVGLLVVYQGLADYAPDAVSDVSRADGYPDVDTLVEAYARASGRDLGHLDWYRAMAYYKLAVILEGIHYRHAQGQTVGEGFDTIGDFVVPLFQAGLTALKET
jgi:aminoglycoside phosphotransferase (APT) family kinase protein